MTNADTQNMIDLVERQTGYRVTVDVISGIYEHAQMEAAPEPVADEPPEEIETEDDTIEEE